MKALIHRFVLAVTGMALSVSVAAGDAARGSAKAGACMACHGGNGSPPQGNFPVLAGQHERYLEVTLKAYVSGRRTNAVMAGIAENLEPDDIADLAAYFTSQASSLR